MFCWRMIRANLVEALVEIDDLCERLRYLEMGTLPEGEYGRWCEKCWKGTTEGSLFISMGHAYHHLCFAWNCRAFPEKRVIACAQADYEAWEKFPTDWPEHWPRSSRSKGTPRLVYNGKIAYLSMRIPLDEAQMALQDVVDDIAATFPETVGDEASASSRHLSSRRRPMRPPMTEEGLAGQMRYVFIRMNEAWNSRRRSIADSLALSPRTLKSLMLFPRAFTRFG
jgi:hypothetical protein